MDHMGLDKNLRPRICRVFEIGLFPYRYHNAVLAADRDRGRHDAHVGLGL